mmetsp:Transcript_21779/g.61623  ORF Transcript_21779/g.61623 Transcript_21779/m.61623 type:complete len:259 (-) Transcript_21779:354-1130(-)
MQGHLEATGPTRILRLGELDDEGERVGDPPLRVEIHGVVTKGIGQLRCQVQHANKGAGAEHVDHRREPRLGEGHGVGPQGQVDDDHRTEQVEVLEGHRQGEHVNRLLLLRSYLDHEVRHSQSGSLVVNSNSCVPRYHQRPLQHHRRPLRLSVAEKRRQLRLGDEPQLGQLLEIRPGVHVLQVEEVQQHTAHEVTRREAGVTRRILRHKDAQHVRVVRCVGEHAPRVLVEGVVPRIAGVRIEDLEQGGDGGDDTYVLPI